MDWDIYTPEEQEERKKREEERRKREEEEKERKEYSEDFVFLFWRKDEPEKIGPDMDVMIEPIAETKWKLHTDSYSIDSISIQDPVYGAGYIAFSCSDRSIGLLTPFGEKAIWHIAKLTARAVKVCCAINVVFAVLVNNTVQVYEMQNGAAIGEPVDIGKGEFVDAALFGNMALVVTTSHRYKIEVHSDRRVSVDSEEIDNVSYTYVATRGDRLFVLGTPDGKLKIEFSFAKERRRRDLEMQFESAVVSADMSYERHLSIALADGTLVWVPLSEEEEGDRRRVEKKTIDHERAGWTSVVSGTRAMCAFGEKSRQLCVWNVDDDHGGRAINYLLDGGGGADITASALCGKFLLCGTRDGHLILNRFPVTITSVLEQ